MSPSGHLHVSFVILLAACSDAKRDDAPPVHLSDPSFDCDLEKGQISCRAKRTFGAALVPDGAALNEQVPIPLPERAADLVVSPLDDQACAISVSRRVYCWGAPYRGHNVDKVKVFPPTLVDGVADVRQLALDGGSVCALVKDGAVWCWGTLWAGFGSGFTSKPVRAPIPPATSIGADFIQMCALSEDGARCWGGHAPSHGRQRRLEKITLLEFTKDAIAVHADGDGRMCVDGPEGEKDCWSTTPSPMR